MRNQLHAYAKERGFSLIEMIMVVAIMMMLALLVMTQSRSSRSGLETTNLAYSIAIFVREAQAYGVAVRQEDIGVNQFNIGYGIYLHENSPNQITLYRDLNKDGLYASPDTVLKQLTFGNGYYIHRFCGVSSLGVQTCSPTASMDTMSISFTRPNPDAVIKGTPGGTSYSIGQIYLRAQNGFEKAVQVYATGQISVN